MEEKTFPLEIKSLTEEGTFEGYAAIFDIPDALGEIVDKGAFTKTLKEGGKTRPMLWYHDPRIPLGTAELDVDGKGMKVKGEYDLNVQAAREKHSLMKKKAIKGLSYGFNTIKDIWVDARRVLKEVKLFEISPVTFQMHPDALVTSVKQWAEQKPYPNEHSARIKDPDLFDDKTFRRTPDGTIYGKIKVPATAAVLWGKLKGSADPSDNPIPQAIRFPTENWTVAEAKKWLDDNNVKYEKFEPASKSFEGVIEFLEEIRSGQGLEAAHLKLVGNAAEALLALLKAVEPPEGTQGGRKGLFSSVIEELETEDKPQPHLFGSTIKTLESNSKQEE